LIEARVEDAGTDQGFCGIEVTEFPVDVEVLEVLLDGVMIDGDIVAPQANLH